MHSQQALKVASVVVTLALSANWVGTRGLRDLRQLRQWFFMAALLSIGYGLTLRGLREAGWRPLAVHALAAAFHTVLVLAWRA